MTQDPHRPERGPSDAGAVAPTEPDPEPVQPAWMGRSLIVLGIFAVIVVVLLVRG